MLDISSGAWLVYTWYMCVYIYVYVSMYETESKPIITPQKEIGYAFQILPTLP